ncbi:hypothetical protein [Desulfonema magnum]|nr:hypothetical protein [Desulfonema magnum]
MDCKKIASESSKCKAYRSEAEDCICEKESVSKYSPCAVQDNEDLIRQIYSPIHVDEDGRLKPLAFEDASNRGMSVNKKNYISKEELEGKISKKLKIDENRGKKRSCKGVAIAKCSEIRGLKQKEKDSETRLFCIYDTATDKDKSHADICQAISGRKAGSKARYELRKVFSEFPFDLKKLFDKDSKK